MSIGLEKARKLLLQIDEMGLPTATEILDPVTARYIADLITWTAIGAMIESNLVHDKQTHSDKNKLKYGVSITDECLGWEDTESLLLDIHSKL